jgi:signal transduction histidine kinase
MSPSIVENEIAGLKEVVQRLSAKKLPSDIEASVAELNQRLTALESAVVDQQVPSENASRLASLAHVSQELGGSVDANEVLKRILDAVVTLTGAERCTILLLDAHTHELVIRASRGPAGTSLDDDAGYSRAIIRTVVEKCAGLAAMDAQTDPRFSHRESVILHGLRSVLCVPLRWQGQTIGVIYAENRIQAGVFKQDDLDFLEAFSMQAAAALEYARLYTRLDSRLVEQVNEMEILAEIDQQLNENLDLSQVAAISLDWIRSRTQAEVSWMAFGAPDAEELIVIGGKQVGETLTVTDDLIYEAWQQRAPMVYTPDGEKPARMVLPILHAEKPTGVLVVERADPFQENDIRFLCLLTGHVAIALENARLVQAVQQTNQAKSQFISVVVHELRIPMTAIKGYADLLRTGAVGPVNETQVNFLDVIRNNVGRMAALISDLSDLNRVESGRLKLDFAKAALADLVQDTTKTLESKFSDKQQTLLVDVPNHLPHAWVDRQRFGQVLTNLLTNAVNYTPVNGTIQVRVEPIVLSPGKQTALKVFVSDNGIGISQEDLVRLFTPFFRSDDAVVREQHGWGLGLSVTRSLVEAMGGQIGVESTRGKGSVFWFTLQTCAEEAEYSQIV